MNVAQQDLNQWRAFCSRLSSALCSADGAITAGSVDQARELILSAQDASARMAMKLELAGAESNVTNTQACRSPAERWYALMLRDAWDAARMLELDQKHRHSACAVLKLLLKEVEECLYEEPER